MLKTGEGAVDPKVKEIETFAGDKRDTVYVMRRQGWQAEPKA